MSDSFDVIIVGSGPAGVSAAFPLVQAGMKVLMVDGGNEASLMPPSLPYLTARYEDDEQWQWMVGKDFHALRKMDAVSPKLRVPTHGYVFDSFLAKNSIESEDFITIGSLAKGGLSNAWGCGVARLSVKELAEYPFAASAINRSYEIVSQRIGLSGANADDLSDYYGLDEWSQPAIAMDDLHQHLFARYSVRKHRLSSLGFQMGRSRVAVLNHDLGERKACDLLGNCLWGCHRKSLYSSTEELAALAKFQNFYYQSGFVVDQISKDVNGVLIVGKNRHNGTKYSAKKMVLAAGTLATTRLALLALELDLTVRIQASPTAAFLLWLPRLLGAQTTNNFGLGQLSFSLQLAENLSAFGSTFSTTGIPVAEFVRHMPLRKRLAIDLLRQLLSSCVVGNLFLPGHLSTTEASLDGRGILKIKGGYDNSVQDLMAKARVRLTHSYWQMGALMMPKSFTQGLPGGDVHYSCTLPMCHNPSFGQTNADGELYGLAGVHVVDGASLSGLTEKSHTLTIMANADRIGRIIATQMKANGEG